MKSQSLVFLDAFTTYENRCVNQEIILRGSNGAWLGLHLHPIPPQTRWTYLGASALLTIREIRSSVLYAEELSATLGLTEAEGEVAAFLSEGITLRNVAKRRDTSYETTRWQLKSIYSKSGCATQSQLIVLIKNLFPNG